MIEVRNVNLPVLGHHRARQVSAADPDTGPGIGRANTLGDGAHAVLLRELAAFGKLDRDAGRLEQARGRLGDQLQRPRGIPRCVGDRAEDFGAGLLLHPRGFQLPFQTRGLRRRRRLSFAGLGLGRFQLAQLDSVGFGQRRICGPAAHRDRARRHFFQLLSWSWPCVVPRGQITRSERERKCRQSKGRPNWVKTVLAMLKAASGLRRTTDICQPVRPFCADFVAKVGCDR